MLPSKCLFPSITGNYHSKEPSTVCLLDDPWLLFIAQPTYPGKNKRNEARDDTRLWSGSCGRDGVRKQERGELGDHFFTPASDII